MLTPAPRVDGPMRVLYVYSGNMYGGVEALLTTLARHRDACPGLEPHYAACWAGRSSAELEEAGATVHILGAARGRDPLSILRVRRALRDLLRREPYDVVVCHSAWSQAIFGPVDAVKLRSSATLFGAVARRPSPFGELIDRFFDGTPCRLTLERLGGTS